MSDTVVLGYWGIRGRGQALRHLLCYTGLKFQEKVYKSPDQYGKDISTLGNFPNLPYLRDGDLTFTETLGIARYIVKRAGKPQMLGKTPEDQAVMDNFIYAFDDLFTPLIGMFFNKKVMDVKTGHFYKIKATLQRFDKFLSQGSVLGYLTIADFFLAEYSHYIQKLYPEQFPKFKNLIAARSKIQNLPQVKAYYQRQNAVLTPFLPPQKTSIPFFWPGTQPAVKPLVPKYSQKSSTESPTRQQPKQQVKQLKQTAKQQVKQAVVKQEVKQQVVSKEPPKQEKKVEQQKPKAPQVQVQQDWENIQVEYYVPQNPHKIAVISGSSSGNAPINYFLQAITNTGHPAVYFEWCDISNLQLHNQDNDAGTDNSNTLRGQVYQCQAVLIGVSQTHHMVSTSLTNAYNWLVPVLKQKPVALVSIQSSQQQFRHALDKQSIPYFKGAKLSVKQAATFFNAEGVLDGANLKRVMDYFNKLAKFIQTGN